MIKVEHPTRGDDTRAWGPPYAKYSQGDDARHVGPPFAENVKENAKGNLKGPGESAYFIAVSQGSRWPKVYQLTTILKVNRNKKSIGLSFQHPEGVKILHELARTSDILVENYIPGKVVLPPLSLKTGATPVSLLMLMLDVGALKKYEMDYDTIRKINPS